MYQAQRQALNFSPLILTVVPLDRVGSDITLQVKKPRWQWGLIYPDWRQDIFLRSLALSFIRGVISSYPHVLSEIVLVDMLCSVNRVTLLCAFAPCESVTFAAEEADPSVGDPRVPHRRSHRRFLYSV